MPKEFVERVLNKLFGSSKNDEVQEPPVITERLVRSERFLKEYAQWADSERSLFVLEGLRDLHSLAENGQTDFLHRYSSPQANGFFFDERAGVKREEFDFLLDHFRDVSLDLGYSIYTSDRKLTEKVGSVQRTDRHYLKPAIPKKLVSPMNQLYGNVLLEYVAYNDNPAYLKVMVSCYSDRNFTEALPYEVFAERLFRNLGFDQ